ncbi:MAG: hypothetical protein LBL23_04570 [Coriobacteriales bacterium]|jgi:hypothetical protein|nr:hypothetical protein [Coriobacteriales bacterium]
MQRLATYADELVTSVGPRPGGSEGEHEAAELIAAHLDDLGLNTWIQEFSAARSIGWVRILYYLLGVVAAELLFALPAFTALAFILALASAALLVLDMLGKNPLYTLFNKGLSQNVIARYVPKGADPRRKIVVVAHYDSGRSMLQCAPPVVGLYVLLRRVIRGCLIALVCVTLLSLLPLPQPLVFFLSILGLIIGIIVLAAALVEVVNLFMPYNQGANCNASGVAAMMGVAETLAGVRGKGEMDRVGASRGAESSGLTGTARNGASSRSRERGEQGDYSGEQEQFAAEYYEYDEYDERDEHEPARAARGSSSRNGIGGVAGSLLSRARGLVGKKEPARSDRGEHFDEQDYEGHVEASGKQKIRSGVPVSREARLGLRPERSGGPEEARSSTGAIGEVESKANTADLALGQAAAAPRAASESRVSGGVGAADGLSARGADLLASEGRAASSPTGTAASSLSGGSSGRPSNGRQWSQERSQRITGAGASGAGQTARSGAEARFFDNPAIKVRPPLDEQQAQEDAEAEALILASEQSEGALPAWFVNAKKAANKDADKAADAGKEPKVVRSRFADVPIEYTPEKAAEKMPEPESAVRQERATGPGARSAKASESSSASRQKAARAADPTQSERAVEADQQNQAAEFVPGQSASVQEPVLPPLDFEPDPTQKSVPAELPPTTLNADFSGIDRLASDPAPKESERLHTAHREPAPREPAPRDSGFRGGSRLPESASALERAAATPAPEIPASERLRNLPKLTLGNSGMIPTQQAAFDQQTSFDTDEREGDSGTKKVSNTGSFAPLGATGIMKPVGEELLQYHDDEQDIYIHDADESLAWNGQASSGGVESAPHLVDIPKSRAKSFFGNLGDRLSGSYKKEDFDSLPSTWLGVDENYDARTEGSQIGGWENFSEEDDEGWTGGAYGGSPEENTEALSRFSSLLIDKEVWIVAIGSHENKNAGIKNLLAEYERELKSALIINLDGVGAGELCYTVAEGGFRARGTDHRLQSLIKSATNALDVPFAPTRFSGYATEAGEALAAGSRAISIMGLDGKLPAGWRWSDDQLDLVNEANLEAVADVVVEVIKSV